MSESLQAEVTSSATRLVHFTCRALLLLLAGATSALAQGTQAPAENYPNKTIRYIVPYPPGAFNDTMGRILHRSSRKHGAFLSWSRTGRAAAH